MGLAGGQRSFRHAQAVLGQNLGRCLGRGHQNAKSFIHRHSRTRRRQHLRCIQRQGRIFGLALAFNLWFAWDRLHGDARSEPGRSDLSQPVACGDARIKQLLRHHGARHRAVGRGRGGAAKDQGGHEEGKAHADSVKSWRNLTARAPKGKTLPCKATFPDADLALFVQT